MAKGKEQIEYEQRVLSVLSHEHSMNMEEISAAMNTKGRTHYNALRELILEGKVKRTEQGWILSEPPMGKKSEREIAWEREEKISIASAMAESYIQYQKFVDDNRFLPNHVLNEGPEITEARSHRSAVLNQVANFDAAQMVRFCQVIASTIPNGAMWLTVLTHRISDRLNRGSQMDKWVLIVRNSMMEGEKIGWPKVTVYGPFDSEYKAYAWAQKEIAGNAIESDNHYLIERVYLP